MQRRPYGHLNSQQVHPRSASAPVYCCDGYQTYPRKACEVKRLDLPTYIGYPRFHVTSNPPHLEHLLLAEDQLCSVDLSGALFRMHRAVGGSWTEYLKTDEELFRLAGTHLTAAGAAAGLSSRTCPFCRVSQGTPRHYVM